MPNAGPRILIWDIETMFNVVAVFQLMHNDYIPHRNILQERYMVSAAWKWLGEPKVYSTSVLDFPERFEKDIRDDKGVVMRLVSLMEEADAIVAHNGDSFDWRWLTARAMFHKLKQLPPVIKIDTKKIAKQHFNFNSNRLDYLAQFMGLGKKKDNEQDLWLKVMAGNRRATQSMVTYNKHDIVILEKVFLKLRPYMGDSLNWQFFGKAPAGVDPSHVCPKCGCPRTKSKGVHYAKTRSYQRRVCLSCGHHFRTFEIVQRLKSRSL